MSITYDFSGKTAVITGSARGIGRRIAERFYEAGANVALCSISPNGKEELMRKSLVTTAAVSLQSPSI